MRKFWSQENVSKIKSRCNCPTLLLELVGNSLSVSGAVFNTSFCCDPLTPLYQLFWLRYDQRAMLQLARVCKAIKLAIDQLGSFYSNLPSASSKTEDDQTTFPFPHTFGPNNISFNYTKQIEDLIYEVKTEHNEVLVVKFTQRYCQEAHHFCANAGFSPQLKAVETVGEWKMVVMQKLEGYISLSEAFKKNQKQTD